MKDFTLYPEALSLKELGFDEPCLGNFADDENHTLFTNGNRPGKTNAPTYSQSFRFFREKYKLDSWIETGSEGIQIANIFTSHKIHVGHYALYEEAELALLKSLIKIVKNKSI